ncbi:MAG TPA: hypothetical protein VEX86_01405 [Longimicrobium sp.]|nr:hypothetical protein [Longimicrobium sp.]
MPPKKPRESRPHGIPPAPPQRLAFGALESRKDAIDLALWHLLRCVLLWARTPPRRRARLFRRVGPAVRERIAAAADAAPLLADPLAVLLSLQEEPGAADPATVAAACDRVYEWADRSGLPATATHFAEASAYAEPTNPRWAIRAGYMTRVKGGRVMLERSEAWHARGYALAVRDKDREMVLRALTGAGALMKDRGEHGKAWRLYVRAARRAVRTGRKRRAAVAFHYSFALAAETGHTRIAVRDAAEALRYYPLHDERLPALAHDVAYLLVRSHYHAAALRLVDGLGHRVDGIAAMGMLFGIAARAAAGAGRDRTYREAAEMALNVARINDECAGPVYINLAEAARLARRWDAVADLAGRALDVARHRADVEVQALALQLLEQAERQDAPPPPSHPDPGAPVAMLARRLAARVRRWRRHNRSAGIHA